MAVAVESAVGEGEGIGVDLKARVGEAADSSLGADARVISAGDCAGVHALERSEAPNR